MTSTVLAEWAADLGLPDLSHDVRHATARHLMDGVGNAVAAARLDYGRPAWTVATALGGPPEARPLTGTQALSAPAAAFATGVMVHALDFEAGTAKERTIAIGDGLCRFAGCFLTALRGQLNVGAGIAGWRRRGRSLGRHSGGGLSAGCRGRGCCGCGGRRRRRR